MTCERGQPILLKIARIILSWVLSLKMIKSIPPPNEGFGEFGMFDEFAVEKKFAVAQKIKFLTVNLAEKLNLPDDFKRTIFYSREKFFQAAAKKNFRDKNIFLNQSKSLLSYRDERRAGAAFVLVGELKICDGIVHAQKILDAFSERARAFAVDNQNLLEAGKLRVVDKFSANKFRLVDSHPANVNAASNGRGLLH